MRVMLRSAFWHCFISALTKRRYSLARGCVFDDKVIVLQVKVFPFYSVCHSHTPDQSYPARKWKQALNHFAILFEDRFPE